MSEFITAFHEKNSLEARRDMAQKVCKKYPGRVPVIVDRARISDPRLMKMKFIVPFHLTLSQFSGVVRKRLQEEDPRHKLSEYDALFFSLPVNEGTTHTTMFPAMNELMSQVYAQMQGPDQFLTLLYTKENAFGAGEAEEKTGKSPGLLVELKDWMGSDVTVANTARVSHDKHTPSLRPADVKLIQFLARAGHMSPFRHIQFQFRITAPEFIARQAFKHNVGISATSGEFGNPADAWNEMSQRYVTVKDVHRPELWRKAPAEKRQGSSWSESFSEEEQENCRVLYDAAMKTAMGTYEALLKAGVAREMARMVLPLSVETKWYWTMSLQAVVHFVRLRKAPEAQAEIQELARQMEALVKPIVPIAWAALFPEEESVGAVALPKLSQ